jgi:hypothetical protein
VSVSLPSTITTFQVKLWGAGGGQGEYSGGNTTGAGGFTTATVTKSGGNIGTLLLQVGQGGHPGSKAGSTGYQYTRSYPDGGLGYYTGDVAGGGGGGRSALFLGSATAGNAIAIAGGGGGSAYSSYSGGAGGGSSGANSSDYPASGGGASQSAGGVAGNGAGAGTGQSLRGGDANGGDGSGGGGGYWGGGSGGEDGRAGGGGSGYVASQTSGSVPSGLTTVTGNTYGAGSATVTPPSQATSDANYPGSNIGYGVSSQNTRGFNGYAVIKY